MARYTVEFDDKFYTYVVVRWEQLSASVSSGEVVYKDDHKENCIAMAEEYQYNAECNEWALNNNQESEFDYV
jgi:hypothetical protein